MASSFRCRLRIRVKATRRTFLRYWPPDAASDLCIATGSKRLVINRAGYSEVNDRGEAVLDSWCEPQLYVSNLDFHR